MSLPETIKKLKRFFFSKLSKQTVILLFVFGLLFSLVPLKVAWAQAGLILGILSGLSGLAKIMTTALIEWSTLLPLLPVIGFVLGADIVLTILAAFTSLFLLTSIQLTSTLTLIPRAGGTDVVSVGFAFTRDLANIGFVLVLAWVAFATILRIRTYQLKSILPKLLIIAVLVNFIPVITGFIIDIADIVTKVFQEPSTNAIGQYIQRMPLVSAFVNDQDITDDVANFLTNPTITLLIKPLVGIVLNGLSIFIFLFYALVFLIRGIAIWVLIILAPLCWLGYIIPGGKKWWSFWWDQFILWAIVGIPIFFFLYLAGYVLQSPTSCQVAATDIWKQIFLGVPTDIVCNVLSYSISIIILLIGLGVSMALAPRGSKGIIGGIKSAAKWGAITAGTVAGVAAARHVGPRAQRLAQGLSEKAATGMQAAATQGGVRGWMKKAGWGAAGLAGSTMQWGATEATGWAAKAQEAKIKAAKAKEKDLPKEIQLAHLVRQLGFAKRKKPGADEAVLGKAEALDDKHNLDWALEKLSEDQLLQLGKLAAKRGKLEDIVKYKPELISKLGKIATDAMVKDGFDDKDVKKLLATMTDSEIADIKADAAKRVALIEQAAFKKAVDELKDADIEGLTEDTLKNTDFQKMVVRFKPWSFNRKLIEEKGLDYGHKLWRRAESIGIDLVAKTNPTFVRAPYTPAGELYFDPFSTIADKTAAGNAIKDAMREIRPSKTVGLAEGVDDIIEDLKALS